jgi:hypothetical protein
MFQLISLYAVSLMVAFCYRFAAIADIIHILHSKRGILIMIIFHMVYMWPFMGLLPSNLITKAEISEIYEEVKREYLDEAFSYMSGQQNLA